MEKGREKKKQTLQPSKEKTIFRCAYIQKQTTEPLSTELLTVHDYSLTLPFGELFLKTLEQMRNNQETTKLASCPVCFSVYLLIKLQKPTDTHQLNLIKHDWIVLQDNSMVIYLMHLHF